MDAISVGLSGRAGRLVVSSGLALAMLLTGCRHKCYVDPAGLSVDPSVNGVFEPGETVWVDPVWLFHSQFTGMEGCLSSNPCASGAPLALVASSFTGPPGPTYTIVDGSANYGVIPVGTFRSCAATGNCYRLSITAPGGRPAAHWDATFVEDLTGSSPLGWISPLGMGALEPTTCPTIIHAPFTWTLHVGASFADVSPSDGFYPFIENLFHHQVTAGCGDGNYCPAASIRRDQMSVFLLKAEHGFQYVPPPCSGLFVDVPCPGAFTDWVEEISNEAVIQHCTDPNAFCPSAPVTRRDMALWLLKASLGGAYQPPPAQGIFGDVLVTDPDAAWIEDLYHHQITAGCSASPLLYCPDNPNTRAQMAVFIDKTFALALY